MGLAGGHWQRRGGARLLLPWSACRFGSSTATWSTSADTDPTRTVVPYAHDPAWAGDSTFLPKSGRRLPGVGWHWHGGKGQVAWGQQLELLLGLDLEEHCSHPVHGHLQPLKGSRSRRSVRRSFGLLRAKVAVMLQLLNEGQAVDHHRPGPRRGFSVRPHPF